MDWMPILWFCLGISFLIIEIISFTLWAFFFSLASFLTWILVYFQVVTTIECQLISFAVCSLFFIFILKNKIKIFFEKGGEDMDDSIVGNSVLCLQDFNKKNNFEGKVEYNGSYWKAVSNAEALMKGEKSFIIERDNITLIVSKNKGN